MRELSIFIVLILSHITVHLAAQEFGSNTDEAIIPFRLTKWNNVSVPAILDERIAINLMFHTAVDSVSLTQDVAEKFEELKFDLDANIESWGGQQASKFSRGHRIEFGPLMASDVSVFLDRHSGHDTDGKFGPSQLAAPRFGIDFDKSQIQVFDRLPKDVKENWKAIPLETKDGMFFVTCELGVGEKRIAQQLLLHSGYSGYLLLDDEFASKHSELQELPVIERNELTDSLGNKLATVKAKLPKFRAGEFEFESVPVSYFSGAIGRQKMSLLGGDFLKRFNLVFDQKQGQLYLQRSQWQEVDYF